MTFNKLKKKDFKENHYELLLTTCYSFVAAIVYSYWVIVALNIFYVAVLVFVGFIILGFVVFYLWINHKKNMHKKMEE